MRWTKVWVPNGCSMAAGGSPDGHGWELHTWANHGGHGHGQCWAQSLPRRVRLGPALAPPAPLEGGSSVITPTYRWGSRGPQLSGLSSQSCEVAEPGLPPESL